MTTILTTKKKNYRKILASFVLLTLLAACASPPQSSDTASSSDRAPLSDRAVFYYGKDSVSAEDFMYVYRKNNNLSLQDSVPMDTAVRDYLDLFINFKLKVKAAREAGMHREENFKQEMAQYSEQLARPYLIENRIVEQLVQESYERLKEEVSASHILVALPQDADPADTLQAYRKADSLRQIALEGASFSMLAEQHSDDPSAARNGGKLGYFTSMQMEYPFETAAYHTPEGQVSDPVRTRFGYHIIKVNDRRPARGSVKVAHLMIRHDDPQKSGKDSEAYRQAMQIYQDLQQGAAWNEMVEKFSDDASTRASGGELPYFDTGGMPEEFEETAFSLNKQGEISEPVATRYGWHLIRLLDRKGLEPLEMLRPLLERKARSIAAQEELTDEMVQLLKEENAYQRNDRHYGELISYLSSRSPEISEPAPGAELFSLNDSSFAYAAFRDFTATQETELPMKKPEAEKLFGQFVAETIFDYEKEHLDEKNDEYRRLLQEYREGILLFNIMEERVWSRASRDTLGLRRFFEQHRDDYRWKERALATIVAAPNQKLLQLALVEARQADAPLSDEKIEEIESKFGQESAAELTIHRDAYERNEARSAAEAVIDETDWQPGSFETRRDGRYYTVIIDEILPPAPKKLEETRGQVIADYQNELDQTWISDLRKRYPVRVNENVVNQIILKLNEEVSE